MKEWDASWDRCGSGQGGGGGGYGQGEPYHVTRELIDALNEERPFRGIYFVEDDDLFRVRDASSSVSIVRAVDAGAPPRVPPARLSVTRDTLRINDAGIINPHGDLIDLTISFPTRSGHPINYDPDLMGRMFIKRNTGGDNQTRLRVKEMLDLIVARVVG